MNQVVKKPADDQTTDPSEDPTLRLDPDMRRFVVAEAERQRLTRSAVKELSRKHGLSDRGLHIMGLVIHGMDRPSKLIEFFEVLPSTITFETDKLVAAGLLLRETDPADRRAVRLRLTPKGYDVHRETIRTVKAILRPRMDRLTAKQREAFLAAYEKIVAP